MIYSINYSNSIKDKIDAEEVIIRYENQKEELVTYLQNHQHQRTVLKILDLQNFIEEDWWKFLNDVKEKYPNFNFSLCLGTGSKDLIFSTQMLEILPQLKIPYFFGIYATTYEDLYFMVNLGVSQVYIAEALGFDIIQVSEYCHKYKVLVRVIPNIAQSKMPIPDIKRFFIRPDDLYLYEPYVDVIEFWGDAQKQHIVKKIYERGKWFGDLKDIIQCFNTSVNNMAIVPMWAPKRMTCRQRCLSGDRCHICDRFVHISNMLHEKHQYIHIDKK